MSARTRIRRHRKTENLPVVPADIDIDETNSVVNLIGQVGKQIAASQFYASGGNGPLTWSGEGLPNPAVINSSTGNIAAFTPTVAGSGVGAKAIATDPDGRRGEILLPWQIYPALAVSLTPIVAEPGFGYNVLPIIIGSGVGKLTFAKTTGSLPAGVTVDPNTGALVATNITATPGNFTFGYQITDENPGSPAVVTLSITITVSAAQNATLDFTGSGNVLRQTVTPGVNFAAATLDATGFSLNLFVNCENLPDAARTIWSYSNINLADSYIAIREYTGGKLGVVWRLPGGGEVLLNCSTAVDAPGHHEISARFYYNGTQSIAEVLVDDQAKQTAVMKTGAWNFSAYNTITFGGLSRSLGLTQEYDHQAYGFALITGDATLAHAWVWNNGIPREITGYNFAGDATADLTAYWRMTKAAAAALDVATDGPALADSVGGLDAFSEIGNLNWAAVKASFLNTTFVPATPTPTIPSTGNTLAFTLTLPVGASWGTIQMDASKINLWATNNPAIANSGGYGPVTVQSMSSVKAGRDATITLQLSRAVCISEQIDFEMLDGAIFDNFNNKPAPSEGAAVNNSTVAVPATTAVVSWGRTAWHLQVSKTDATPAPRPVRFSLEGCPHVDLSVAAGGACTVGKTTPPRLDVSETNPGWTNNGGIHTMNGSMLNAVRYPNRLGFNSHNLSWNAGKSVAFPVDVKMHDCLISSISNPDETMNFSVWYQSFIHFTDGLIGATEIARSAGGYDGTAARRAVTAPNINAIAAALPTYSTAGIATAPDIAELVWRFCRVNMTLPLETSVAQRTQLTPRDISYDNGGYGEHINLTFGAAMLCLISDMDVIEKRKLVLWCCHHSHQIYETVSRIVVGGNVAVLAPNGGHNQGLLPFIVAGLKWTGQESKIGTIYSLPPNGVGPMNEGGQDYFRTADHIAAALPHDRPIGPSSKAGYAKRKTITAVSTTPKAQGSGAAGVIPAAAGTITCGGMTGAETDIPMADLQIVRESDGQNTLCVRHRIRGLGIPESFEFDYYAQVSPPFAVGNVIYLTPVTQTQIGDANWAEGQSLSLYGDTSKWANYRLQQYRSASVLFLRATGLMHPSFLPTEAYCELAVQVDAPPPADGVNAGLPANSHDYGTVHRGYVPRGTNTAVPFALPFWDAWWPTIKPTPVDPTIL